MTDDIRESIFPPRRSKRRIRRMRRPRTAPTMPHIAATVNEPHRIQTGKKRFIAISSLHTKDSAFSVVRKTPF